MIVPGKPRGPSNKCSYFLIGTLRKDGVLGIVNFIAEMISSVGNINLTLQVASVFGSNKICNVKPLSRALPKGVRWWSKLERLGMTSKLGGWGPMTDSTWYPPYSIVWTGMLQGYSVLTDE